MVRQMELSGEAKVSTCLAVDVLEVAECCVT
jgi:hypothetical protein